MLRFSDKALRLSALTAVGAASALLLSPQAAHAVPSFARQTGLSCESCHTVFPELTPFGRMFKMTGYTLQNVTQVRDMNAQARSTLSIDQLPPISMMLQITGDHVAKPVPDTGNNTHKQSNNNVQFPRQASFFYAGRIADHLGSFMQITYDQKTNAFNFDNTDIRYANQTNFSQNNVIYGLTLNNNPTVQDPWNSTLAWGYPFIHPNDPSASGTPGTYIDGLGQLVAGLGGYAFVNRAFYAEFDGYTNAQLGTKTLDSSTAQADVIKGVAPYWRLAYSREWENNSFEIGHFGMSTKVVPQGSPVDSGPYNTYLDLGLDGQYQYITDNHQVGLYVTYVNEKQSLDADYAAGNASNNTDHLNQLKLAATYYYQHRFGGSVGYNDYWGSTDALKYSGNTAHNPNTQYGVLEVDYLPWLNTKLFAQYDAYFKINGESSNYKTISGQSRNASDNNTVLVGLWTAF